MQSDDADLASQDITIGSSRKGNKIIAKTGKRNQPDNISVATTDSVYKLKAISSYSKKDLVELAQNQGIEINSRMNKNDIYDAIKNHHE